MPRKRESGWKGHGDTASISHMRCRRGNVGSALLSVNASHQKDCCPLCSWMWFTFHVSYNFIELRIRHSRIGPFSQLTHVRSRINLLVCSGCGWISSTHLSLMSYEIDSFLCILRIGTELSSTSTRALWSS